MPALVLFDYGEIHSFVFLRFRKKFTHAIGNFDHPLRVEIVDNRASNASKVYRSCTLVIGNDSFSIDLIPIPMRKMRVIVGTHWLNQFKALNANRKKIVRV